jgi:hypothetical protein
MVEDGQLGHPRHDTLETVNRRPRLTIVAPNASVEEAAAVVAALEQFMRTTAPPAAPAPTTSAWLTAALHEGVARQPDAAPPWA